MNLDESLFEQCRWGGTAQLIFSPALRFTYFLLNYRLENIKIPQTRGRIFFSSIIPRRLLLLPWLSKSVVLSLYCSFHQVWTKAVSVKIFSTFLSVLSLLLLRKLGLSSSLSRISSFLTFFNPFNSQKFSKHSPSFCSTTEVHIYPVPERRLSSVACVSLFSPT